MQLSKTEVHPTAIVAPEAAIGEGCSIGAYSIIGSKVKLGRNNRVGPHVVIEGTTEIGDENELFQFCSIGSRPQDLKYRGEDSRLVIGNKNLIREYVTIQPGTHGGGMLTSVGDKNLFMANCHTGHDCRIGNGNVIANSCALAGHVTIGNNTILGGLSAVHQFCRVGDFAMLGGGAMLTLDLIPCGIAQGDRAKLAGINLVGLERAGFSTGQIQEVKDLYKDLFIQSGVFAKKLAEAVTKFSTEGLAKSIVDFIQTSERGIAHLRSKREA